MFFFFFFVLQEIFVLEDCRFFDNASTDRSSDYTNTNISSVTHSDGAYTVVSSASSSTSTYYAMVTPTGVSMPSNFEASVDMYFTTDPNSNLAHVLIATNSLTSNSNSLNSAELGHYRVNKGFITRPWDDSLARRTNGTLSDNTWYKFIIQYNNGVFTGIIKQGDTTVFSDSISMSKTFNYVGACENAGHNTYKFKNLKIKAL